MALLFPVIISRVRLASSRHLFYTTAGQCYCHNAVAILYEFDQLCKEGGPEGGCDPERQGRLHKHNDPETCIKPGVTFANSHRALHVSKT